MARSAAQVRAEDGAGRGVQGDEARLAELRAPDGQDRGLEVDIVKLEIACLAEAEARHAEQAQECVVHPGAQASARVPARHGARGAQQLANLGRGVEIRAGALRLKRQEPGRRNLRAGIGGAPIVREGAHDAQAAGPVCGLGVRGLLRPGQRQRLRDHRRAALLEKPDELVERLARVMKLEAEMAPHPEVLVGGVAEAHHRAPPGHRSASVRSAGRSTFAYSMVVWGWRCRRISPISVSEAPCRNRRVARACRN